MTAGVDEVAGRAYYTVKPGDTLSGISARLLGESSRWPEILESNPGVARVGECGPVLRHPELIWPGLRLLLPPASPGSAGGPS